MENSKTFVESKLKIIETIKHIYAQILEHVEEVVEEIESEKLTDNLATSIEFLKEIKCNQKQKYIRSAIYN